MTADVKSALTYGRLHPNAKSALATKNRYGKVCVKSTHSAETSAALPMTEASALGRSS